jgi:hypothetical protein
LLGTRWGQEGAKLVPAPGDPWYATYTYDPLNAPLNPTPAAVAAVTDPPETEDGSGAAPPEAAPAPASPDLQLAPMDGGGN